MIDEHVARSEHETAALLTAQRGPERRAGHSRAATPGRGLAALGGLGRRRRLMRFALLSADATGFAVALIVADAATGRASVLASPENLALWLTVPAWFLLADLYGLYGHDDDRIDHSTADDATAILGGVTFAVWFFVVLSVLTGHQVDLLLCVTLWALALPAVTMARVVARTAGRRQTTYLQNTIILGGGPIGERVGRKILQHREYGLNLVGYVDEKRGATWHEQIAYLGGRATLEDRVRLLDVERVVVAFPPEVQSQGTVELVRRLQTLGVRVDLIPWAFELISPHNGIHTIEGVPLIGLRPPRLTRSSRMLKRGLDVVAALMLLVILTPIFLVVSILIKRDSPGPVFFKQVRMGQGERTFELIKFRTMVVDAEERKDDFAHLNIHAASEGPRMFKIWADPRVTRVGRSLRQYFLDELPQLINVLRGEMSLVGPRPLILDEDSHVTEWARRRLDLKPGLTGLWQVTGRSVIPFEEMVELDFLYVMNWSVRNDLRLLFRTVPLVFRGDGGSF